MFQKGWSQRLGGWNSIPVVSEHIERKFTLPAFSLTINWLQLKIIINYRNGKVLFTDDKEKYYTEDF